MLPTRKRLRALEANEENQVPAKLRILAQSAYLENKKANAAKAAYERDRKDLFGQMELARVGGFTFTGHDELGSKLILEATISAATGQAVDVQKLRKLVNDEQFMAIVSATQGAIKAVVGEAVLTQCLVPVTGERNVHVKPKK